MDRLGLSASVFLLTAVGSGCVYLMDIGTAPREVWKPAPTQELPTGTYQPGYRKSVAVLIGINEYQRWPDLEGAVADAQRMKRVLRERGFSDILELHDEDASREEILEVLTEDLPELVGENDLTVIYFAGHGQTETLRRGARRGYILPADADSQLVASAISMELLRDVALRLDSKHVLYVMDSCYAGSGFTRGGGMSGESKADPTTRSAVQMMTAGLSGDPAREKDGQGLFTTHLIDGLAGLADEDRDGYVSAGELGKYVADRVTAETGNRQTPQFGTLEGSGEVRFTVGHNRRK